jgi:hypothetical protein
LPGAGSGDAPFSGGAGEAVFSCAAALRPLKSNRQHSGAAKNNLCFIFFLLYKKS